MKKKHDLPLEHIEFERVIGANVSITPHYVQLAGRDPGGNRIVLEFTPYQGIRITSIDCFPGYQERRQGGNSGRIFIVERSRWLSDLRRALKERDHTADFLDAAQHHVIPAEDAVVEIIASGWMMKKSLSKLW